MPEVVGTLTRPEVWHERTDGSVEAPNSPRCNLAQQRLEFAVGQLDRIEIGRVFRQESQCRPDLLDRFFDADNPVGGEVVEHDNIVAA